MICKQRWRWLRGMTKYRKGPQRVAALGGIGFTQITPHDSPLSLVVWHRSSRRNSNWIKYGFWCAHVLDEDCRLGLGTQRATAIVDRKHHMQTGQDVLKRSWFSSDEVCTVTQAARYTLSCRYYNQGCRAYEISHPYPHPQMFRGYPWIYPYPQMPILCTRVCSK